MCKIIEQSIKIDGNGQREKKTVKNANKQNVVIVSGVIIAIVSVVVIIMLCVHIPNKSKEPIYSSYVSLRDGFSNVVVTDEKSAKEAVASVAGILGIRDVEEELQIISVNEISDSSFYRFQQYYNSFEVYGRNLSLSVDKSGKVSGLTSNCVVVDEKFDSVVKSSDEEIISSVIEYLDKNESFTNLNFSKLVDNKFVCYVTEDDECVLAYNFSVDDIGEFIVDAKSLEVLLYNRAYSYNSVECEYNGRKYPAVATGDNKYMMGDEHKGIFIFSADGSEIIKLKNNLYSGYRKDLVKPILSKELKFSSSDTAPEVVFESGINLLEMLSDFSDFFIELNKNQNASVAVVINNGTINDTASGSYVDADSITEYNFPYDKKKITSIIFGSNHSINNYFEDKYGLVGHEYMHGITGSIVDFYRRDFVRYDYSGALDEAYSDIFGEILEEEFSGHEADWKHGERNMIDPSDYEGKVYPYPTTLEDFLNATTHTNESGLSYCTTEGKATDCAHFASTIISHCAYLMYNGIDGDEEMKLHTGDLAQLWYRSLFMLHRYADFPQFRNALELSARAMCNDGDLSEAQYNCVIQALNQTGIHSAPYSNFKVVDNEFHVSVLNYVTQEHVNAKIEVFKANVEIDDVFSDSQKGLVYAKDLFDGSCYLNLESGGYYIKLTDTNMNKTGNKPVLMKILVDSTMSDKTNSINIYTDFTDIHSRIINENIDYDSLVSDAYYKKVGDSEFAVPKIMLDGAVIENINNEIWEKYYEHYTKLFLDAEDTYGMGHASYDWSVTDDVLSLLVKGDYVDSALCTVYNLNVKTTHDVDNEEIVRLAGFTMDDYYEKLKSAISEYLWDTNEYKIEFGLEKFKEDYNKALSETISQSNLRDARPYINSKGQLCAVVIFTIVDGTGSYQDVLNLEDFEVIDDIEKIENSDKSVKEDSKNNFKNDVSEESTIVGAWGRKGATNAEYEFTSDGVCYWQAQKDKPGTYEILDDNTLVITFSWTKNTYTFTDETFDEFREHSDGNFWYFENDVLTINGSKYYRNGKEPLNTNKQGDLISILEGAWATKGNSFEYIFYSDGTYEENTIIVSSGTVVHRSEMSAGQIDIRSNTQARLYQNTKDDFGSIQSFSELIYYPESDTISVGGNKNVFYRATYSD